MADKNILSQLNIFAQCKRYGLPLWQCPSFLFLVMGLIIMISSVTAYAVGTRLIENPKQVALIVLALAGVLFIIAFVITQSFEKLAEANRMKSEFVNVVSHQLRTPISNLNWAIDLLMSGRLGTVGEKQAEYFRILRENTGRMRELVGDLLTVSRIELGSLPLKKEKTSLQEIVLKAIEDLSPFAKASNVEIRLQVQPSLPDIFVDPSQMRLVVENLLDNAVRYIKDKGKVKASLYKKNGTLHFEVKDNGVGIPREDKKYIFQKFFRSGSALRYQTEGSGLGLYIAKSIVERSGGKIGFESQEGKGSTFWFTLPIKS